MKKKWVLAAVVGGLAVLVVLVILVVVGLRAHHRPSPHPPHPSPHHHRHPPAPHHRRGPSPHHHRGPSPHHHRGPHTPSSSSPPGWVVPSYTFPPFERAPPPAKLPPPPTPPPPPPATGTVRAGGSCKYSADCRSGTACVGGKCSTVSHQGDGSDWVFPEISELPASVAALKKRFTDLGIATLDGLAGSMIWKVASVNGNKTWTANTDGLCNCPSQYAGQQYKGTDPSTTLDGLWNALAWSLKLERWGALFNSVSAAEQALLIASFVAISGDESGCWATCNEACGNEGWYMEAGVGYPRDNRNCSCGPVESAGTPPIYLEKGFCKNAEIAAPGIWNTAQPVLNNHCTDPTTRKHIGYQCGTTAFNQTCCYWGRGPLQTTGSESYQGVGDSLKAAGITGYPDPCSQPNMICAKGGIAWFAAIVLYDQFLWSNFGACFQIREDLEKASAILQTSWGWAGAVNVAAAAEKKGFWDHTSEASLHNICLKLYMVNANNTYGARFNTYGCAGVHFCQLLEYVFKPLFVPGGAGTRRPTVKTAQNPAFCCEAPKSSTPNICQVCSVPDTTASESGCPTSAWMKWCPAAPGTPGCPMATGKNPYAGD